MPCSGLRCRPEMVPSTTRWARRPRRTIWARISGLKYGLNSAMARLRLRVQGNGVDQLLDHGLGRLSLCLGVVVQHETMTQHGFCESFDVVHINLRTTIERGACFCGGDERLTSARADA